MPLVTVGLPCYNSAKTLVLALKSVFAQTFEDWELICVDDGSSDDTLKLLQSINDPRVRVLSDGKNFGLAARLNQIARKAKGKYLARMDADDVMFPERLAKQVAYLEANECDLLGTSIVCIDQHDRCASRRQPRSMSPTCLDIFAGEVLFHPTVMGLTSWFRENPYDEGLRRSQDFELWCRVATRVRIRNLSEPLLFYREYGSLSWAKYRQHSRLTKNVVIKHGPDQIGLSSASAIIRKRRLKDCVYGFLFMSGLSHFVFRLRNTPLKAVEKELFDTAVQSIQNGTQLPTLQQ